MRSVLLFGASPLPLIRDLTVSRHGRRAAWMHSFIFFLSFFSFRIVLRFPLFLGQYYLDSSTFCRQKYSYVVLWHDFLAYVGRARSGRRSLDIRMRKWKNADYYTLYSAPVCLRVADVLAFFKEVLSVLMLCASVYIYIRHLSSFRAPTWWFIDLTVATFHIQYIFFFTRKRTKHENTRCPPFSYRKKMAAGGY